MVMATPRQESFLLKLLQERPSYASAGEIKQALVDGSLTVQRASTAIGELLRMPDERPVVQVKPLLINASEVLPRKGTYTVVLHAGKGKSAKGKEERRTLRFREGKFGFFAGKVVIKYLSGSDNESSYTGFANIADDGNVRIWRKFSEDAVLQAAIAYLGSKEAQAQAGETYALEAGRCWNCNKLLTVPASVTRGLGPECAKRLAVV